MKKSGLFIADIVLQVITMILAVMFVLNVVTSSGLGKNLIWIGIIFNILLIAASIFAKSSTVISWLMFFELLLYSLAMGLFLKEFNLLLFVSMLIEFILYPIALSQNSPKEEVEYEEEEEGFGIDDDDYEENENDDEEIEIIEEPESETKKDLDGFPIEEEAK